MLDVVSHDDLAPPRTGYGPENTTIVERVALNLLDAANPSVSFVTRRKRAGRDDNHLLALISRSI